MSLSPAARAAAAGLAADPAGVLLGLDFDGTLAPVVAEPGTALAHPASVAALARLAPRLGRVAVVTGRPALTAVRLGGLDRPGLERLLVLGQYGVERWEAATGLVAPPVPDGIAGARRELLDLIERLGVPGLVLEEKGRAVALHTRRAADPTATLHLVHGPVSRIARTHGLVVEPGRFVLEVRDGTLDKGGALRGLVAASSPRSVVFVGDDLGDLPAFAAVAALAGTGIAGLAICSASAEQPDLAAAADLVLDGPAGVAEWLTLLANLVDT
jgi:trehalose 6-phosphate phosphatase